MKQRVRMCSLRNTRIPSVILWLAWLFGTGHTAYVQVLPARKILYKNVDNTISVCVRMRPRSDCQSGHNAHCTFKSLLPDVRIHRNFHENLPLHEFEPGVYKIECEVDGSVRTRTGKRVLLLQNNVTYLDCASLQRTVQYVANWFVARACCRRLPVKTEWLRALGSERSLHCEPVDCTTDSREISVKAGLLFTNKKLEALPRKITVHCEDGFEQHIHLYDPLKHQLVVRLRPSGQVLFKSDSVKLAVCLGWNSTKGCLVDVSLNTYMKCQAIHYQIETGRPSGIQWNFDTSMELNELKEGTIRIQCTSEILKLNRTFVRFLINDGRYELHCDAVPAVIMLNSEIHDKPFCKRIANVSKKWSQVLSDANLKQWVVKCRLSASPSTEFENAHDLLRANPNASIGLYEFFCGEREVHKTLLVINKTSQLKILLEPVQYIINNTQDGELEAKYEVFGETGITASLLLIAYPITCNLTYSTVHQNLVWKFTNNIHFDMLLHGPIKVSCSNSKLNVTARFSRFVATDFGSPLPLCVPPRAVKVDKSPHQHISCRRALLSKPTVLAVAGHSDSVSCANARGTTVFEDGLLQINSTNPYLSLETIYCSGSVPKDSQILFYDSEVTLVVDPKQAFYVSKQKKPIEFYFQHPRAPGSLNEVLKRMPLACSLMNVKGSFLSLILNNTLDLSQPPLDQLESSDYTVTCVLQSSDLRQQKKIIILNSDDFSLVIDGPKEKTLFNDQPFAFQCTLFGPSRLEVWREQSSPRWYTIQGLTGSSTYGNELYFTEDVEIGDHRHVCYYENNGLSLRELLTFRVQDLQQLRLNITYTDAPQLPVYYVGQILPTMQCRLAHSSDLIKLTFSWIMLSGQIMFRTFKRRGAAILSLSDNRPGYGSFMCKSLYEGHCIRHLVAVYYTVAVPKVDIYPRYRVTRVPKQLTCFRTMEPLDVYDVQINVISSFKFYLENDSVHITDEALLPRIRPFAAIECKVVKKYLATVLFTATKTMVVELAENTEILITPKKIAYNKGDVLRCDDTTGAKASKILLHLVSHPKNFKGNYGTLRTFKLDKNFPGGHYVLQCHLFQKHRVAFDTSRGFMISVLPSRAEITERRRSKSLPFFECTSDGYPLTLMTYEWRVEKHPGGLIETSGNRLYITTYTVTGELRISCIVLHPSLTDSAEVRADYVMTYYAEAFQGDQYVPFFQKNTDRTIIILNTLTTLGFFFVMLFSLSILNQLHRYRKDNLLSEEEMKLTTQCELSIEEADIGPIFSKVLSIIRSYDEVHNMVVQTGAIDEIRNSHYLRSGSCRIDMQTTSICSATSLKPDSSLHEEPMTKQLQRRNKIQPVEQLVTRSDYLESVTYSAEAVDTIQQPKHPEQASQTELQEYHPLLSEEISAGRRKSIQIVRPSRMFT
ncbi:hypothetical protein CSKR_113619 [Clonorchis sinensis]|uniref:Ig-like domain-containing protein n=1 Tax=Clonorchis sinensis TaxID=79923 RepID=A0A8T1M261_CLOSI|nr:hypothetical protein CSKR_113619 [Clonorchis sinensis]